MMGVGFEHMQIQKVFVLFTTQESKFVPHALEKAGFGHISGGVLADD
jgi:hypothetical protein